MEFLGYQISKNKIKPGYKRGQGIQTLKRPMNRKQLQKFLGIINYDRMFVEKITELALPLYQLLKKENSFIWTEKHEEAFNMIKKKFVENLELTMPDFSQDFVLETDASNVGLGAVLKQNNAPICYISRTLTGAEKRYSVIERECLAALWSMEKLEEYLMGRKFLLKTDNKAIEELKSKLEFGSHRIKRWFERFQRFDFEIEYIPGENNKQADFLSRYPHINNNDEINTKVMDIHKNNSHRKNIINLCKEMGLEINNDQLIKILRKCEICAKFDPKVKSKTQHIPTTQPGEILACDLMELKRGEIIIVGLDYFSRKVWAKRIKRKKPEIILQFLKTIYEEFRFVALKCDNGKEFSNKLIKNWCSENEIELKFSIPYLSKTNGRVERVNRTLRNSILKGTGRLSKRIDEAIEIYNRTEHRGIGMSPNDAVKRENWELVIKNGKKYGKEFEKKKGSSLKLEKGTHVLIRNEKRFNKMQPRYLHKGEVVGNPSRKKYEIKLENGKHLVRHEDQLRIL